MRQLGTRLGFAITSAFFAAIAVAVVRFYLKQEKASDAFAAASRAVALTPGKTPAITALGEVYFRQGKMKLAQDSFLNPQKVWPMAMPLLIPPISHTNG